jgi:hypothetical protein
VKKGLETKNRKLFCLAVFTTKLIKKANYWSYGYFKSFSSDKKSVCALNCAQKLHISTTSCNSKSMNSSWWRWRQDCCYLHCTWEACILPRRRSEQYTAEARTIMNRNKTLPMTVVHNCPIQTYFLCIRTFLFNRTML